MSSEKLSNCEQSCGGSGHGGGSKDEKGRSRRDFLRYGAMAGAAAMVGLTTGCGDMEEPSAGGGDHSHESSSPRTVRLYNEDGQLVEVKAEAICHTADPVTDNEELRRGVEGMSFVMVIDLARCRNARRCVEDCQKAHGLRPDQEYLRVNKMGDVDDRLSHNYWMPQLCFQCDNPPCTKVCPVDATFKRGDGIVAIDNEKCIGCRFCMAACPYNARVFNWNEPLGSEESMEYSPETSLPKKKGTVDKCDFCPDMVRAGKLPHCVPACPNGVIYFGDRNQDVVTNGNQVERLSTLLQERGGYRFLESLGTRPRVYYLPARNKQFPFERGLENYEEAREFMEEYRLERRPSDHGSSESEGGEQ